MKARTAAPVAITVSLAVLLTGCAGVAAQGGQVGGDRSQRSISADARRELHSQAAQEQSARSMSADARRELHSQPVTVERTAFSSAAIRELKGSAPVDVRDDLSPIRGDAPTPTPTPQGDTVDDDLSPLGGPR